MAIDHNRPLPVSEERREALAQMLHMRPYAGLSRPDKVQLIHIALLEAQVDALNDVRFFLSEAYDIYNARFR